jgi:SAM-dependent methyltransferase/glycosyltransferase involved in cell wall biosynthesis
MDSAIPVPPAQLHQRVAGPTSDESNYEENGRRAREDIVGLLPDDWSWEGKRLLDFGCGPGRVLRQFMAQSEMAELHGCDIYGPGIAWLQENAPSHVKLFVNDEVPPLDRPDSHFDLIWAVSVFTHLVETWSRWLLEIHRVLKPGGLFVTTFHNEANHVDFAAYDPEPWSEDHIGMNVMSPSVGWDKGGPAVFHSGWWIEAHWGRLFEVLEIRRSGFGGLTQGVVLLRRKDVRLRPADLEHPEPGEPREYAAARHNVRQLQNEIAVLTAQRDGKAAEPEARRFSVPTVNAGTRAALARDGRGVNVVGYLRGELGVGEAARQLIAALDSQRIPVMPINRHLTDTRTDHPFACVEAPSHGPFAVNVICENALVTARCAEVMGEGFFADRYTAGLWFWEVGTLPALWDEAFAILDEVWVASDHVAAAVRARSPIPVTKIPLPVAPTPPAKLKRAALGLPQDFLFLFVFDYNSVLERKNPLGLIEAFTRAFPPGSGPALAIKAINGDKRPADRERVRAAAGAHPEVHLIEQFHSAAEKNALIAGCDCYVSLHRAEGFGLTMAEAVWFGRPVIATGYSGNLEFTTPDTAWLVDHAMRPIGPGADPYPADGEWADPDLEHAARLMRHVVEHPEEAAERAERGAQAIKARHSPAAAGAVIAARLEEMMQLPRRPPAPSGELTELRRLIAAGPRPAPGLGRLRGAARDALLRGLRPLTAHRDQVDRELIAALEEIRSQQGVQLAQALASQRSGGEQF